MAQSLRIVSWNIAGGHTVNSLAQFDYHDEDLDYFASQIEPLNPDIVCLQEIHINHERSTANELAAKLGLSYVYDVDVSPSHIDKNYRLGNAIISRHPLKHVTDAYYPFPEFQLRFPNGKLAPDRHDKMVQIYKFKDFLICNTQMLPLDLFGYSYVKGEGNRLAQEIEKILLDNLAKPIIFCGDFNFDAPERAYPKLYAKLSIRNILPIGFTRPKLTGRIQTPDHILVSDEISCVESGIIEVNADHSMCYCKLEY